MSQKIDLYATVSHFIHIDLETPYTLSGTKNNIVMYKIILLPFFCTTS